MWCACADNERRCIWRLASSRDTRVSSRYLVILIKFTRKKRENITKFMKNLKLSVWSVIICKSLMVLWLILGRKIQLKIVFVSWLVWSKKKKRKKKRKRTNESEKEKKKLRIVYPSLPIVCSPYLLFAVVLRACFAGKHTQDNREKEKYTNSYWNGWEGNIYYDK